MLWLCLFLWAFKAISKSTTRGRNSFNIKTQETKTGFDWRKYISLKKSFIPKCTGFMMMIGLRASCGIPIFVLSNMCQLLTIGFRKIFSSQHWYYVVIIKIPQGEKCIWRRQCYNFLTKTGKCGIKLLSEMPFRQGILGKKCGITGLFSLFSHGTPSALQPTSALM